IVFIRNVIVLYVSNHTVTLLLLHYFPTRRSSDLRSAPWPGASCRSTPRAGAPRARSFSSGPTRCGSATTRRAARRSCRWGAAFRSEEHTSELQSRENLVCRLLLEKKKDI